MVESTKERQEKAALTFTTVSVLFFPLTMIASVFGINTNDIRNTDNLWIFWATAAPTCIIGLLLWLAYIGTLSNWVRSLVGVFRTSNPATMRISGY
jgi:Mg2+ and Co2+ transporter CorA